MRIGAGGCPFDHLRGRSLRVRLKESRPGPGAIAQTRPGPGLPRCPSSPTRSTGGRHRDPPPATALAGWWTPAPLMEREHALQAGLGLIGKNTLMIRPGEGSWMVLGEVLTTLELGRSRTGVERPGATPAAPARGASMPARPRRSGPSPSTPRGASATGRSSIGVDRSRGASIDRGLALRPPRRVPGRSAPHNLPQRRVGSLPVLIPTGLVGTDSTSWRSWTGARRTVGPPSTSSSSGPSSRPSSAMR